MVAAIDPFYEQYANKGLIASEILINGIIAVICLTGICLNLCLVYVTIKTKSLHSPCKTLIALFAFCSSFLLFGTSIKFFVFLFGINYILLKHCFFIQLVPLIGSSIAVTLQLGIGSDRLFGVMFPIWYKSHGKYTSFKGIIAFCCIKLAFSCFVNYSGSAAHWEKPVMCHIGDPSHQQPKTAYYTDINVFITYCAEFVCYALIWLIIWRRTEQITEHVKKLTISVSVLMSIGLFGYILNLLIVKGIIPLLNLDPFAIEFCVIPISLFFQTLAYGSSAPVLYFCNAQYHSAFRSQFALHQANNNAATVVVQFSNNQQHNINRQLNVENR
ncbi:hypothetical protein niasHT_018569 [Heterodera trifolii]|uniref:Uncharacterized protein n=1 Tax=Heterodera trifolii TaxID=157864 RepID=A0ABD2LBQ0_9BILA